MDNDFNLELDTPSSSDSGVASASGGSAPATQEVPASPQPGAQDAGGSASSQEPGGAPSTGRTQESEPPARTISEEQYRQAVTAAQAREAAYQRQLQEISARQRASEDQLFEARVAQLPPEQQAVVRAQREFAQREASVQQAAQRQAEQIRALEPVFEEMVVRELLDTYRNVGVTRADLKRFNSPEAMEAFCEATKERHRAAQVKSRAQTGADAAAAAGSGARPAPKADWRSQTLQEQLRDAFRD